MNLVIGFVIVMCLVISEARDPDIVTDAGQRVLLVGLLSLLSPGLALVQTITLSRQFRFHDVDEVTRQKQLQRTSNLHGISWLAISLLTIGWLRWPDVVQTGWNQPGYPVVTELLVLAPVILSLLLSWAIFFDVQRALDRRAHCRIATAKVPSFLSQLKTGLSFRKRTRFVATRFRAYLLIVLIPLLAAVVTQHFVVVTANLPTGYKALLWTGCGLCFLAAFPFLMLLTWNSRRFTDRWLHRRLLVTCRRLKLGIFDVRIWDTGNRVVNAMVTGVFPGSRVILLSDRLIHDFSTAELLAVVRHEAGHVRLRHLPVRMLFILLPLLLLMIDQACQIGLIELLLDRMSHLGISDSQSAIAGVLAYFAYLLPMLAWLSRQMEFEADWFAVHTESKSNSRSRSTEANDEFAEFDGMTLAIARLATHSPQLLRQRTLLYPSLQERLNRTRRTAQSDSGPQDVRERVAFRNRLVNFAIAGLATGAGSQAVLSLLGY